MRGIVGGGLNTLQVLLQTDALLLRTAVANQSTQAHEHRFETAMVEDRNGLRDVTMETLADRGHQVVGADCAEAVSELPADFSPEIAILDLNLPGEDGLQLTVRLRQVQLGIGT